MQVDKLGGGGTGTITSWGYNANLKISAGGIGTSYSGGSGSAGITSHSNNITYIQPDISNIGGNGGNGYAYRELTNWKIAAGGGAGNPGGKYGTYAGGTGENGKNGTGGLLIIYARSIENNGDIEAKGSNGGNGVGFLTTGGGASGGGSINIFYKNVYKNNGNYYVEGGKGGSTFYSSTDRSQYYGGDGGKGTISIQQVR